MSKFESNENKLESGKEEEKPPLTTADLERIVSKDHLQAISRASGRFQFAIDNSSGLKGPVGYTNMETRMIYLNGYHLAKMSEQAIKGILTHEAGHHAPEVIKFQDKIITDVGHPDFFPKNFPEDVGLRAKVRQAAVRHLGNSLFDCWLEAFMSRGSHRVAKKNLSAIYEYAGERPTLKSFELPEQLTQLLVGEDRYPGKTPIKDLVDDDVYEEYQGLKSNRAIKVINNANVFDNDFATDVHKDADIENKFLAYKIYFLPAWLNLLKKELEKQKDKDGGNSKKSFENLTDDEKKILEEILDKLIEAGKKYESIAPSDDKENNPLEKLKKLIEELKNKEKEGFEKDKEEGVEEKKGEDSEKELTAEQEMINKARQLQQLRQTRGQLETAERHGVSVETVKLHEEIISNYEREIEDAAHEIAEVFVDDRRSRMEYGYREGMVTEGLEYEYKSEVESDNPSPKTHSRNIRYKEFLETEIEFIQDVSGSMSGEPLEKSIELQVILQEAFRRVREILLGQQLLGSLQEEPLRIGCVKFSDNATRVKTLDEPNTLQTQLEVIESIKRTEGGTDERAALEGVYSEFKLRKKNVLKIMIVLSDGEGQQDAVQNIMQQIEDDDEVVVAAVGLGSNAKSVVEAYTGTLRKGDKSNVYGFEKENAGTLLPDLLEFLKNQIRDRRKGR